MAVSSLALLAASSSWLALAVAASFCTLSFSWSKCLLARCASIPWLVNFDLGLPDLPREITLEQCWQVALEGSPSTSTKWSHIAFLLGGMAGCR